MTSSESVTDVEGRNEFTLTLTANQALVFFGWLSRNLEEDGSLPIDDDAERFVLWRVEGMLESALVSPFRDDYVRLLELALNEVKRPGA